MTRQALTRRDALKSAMASAAAVAAPAVIPASALGRAGQAPPSERVRLGHIGVGARGRMLFSASQNRPNIQSVAVADCYQDRREELAARIEGEAYADFRRILDRDDIDGVVVATPDHWHVPIAILAAKAGKDVYLEKPLGLTIGQGLACKRVLEEEERVFQYGTQQRSAAHHHFGKDLVRSGKLGQLKAIEIRIPNGGRGGSNEHAPVPEGFDYDMWLGPAPEAPYTVDRCRPKGTYWVYDHSIGYLAGWGAHPLDVMVLCYDGDQAGPFTVEGTGVIPGEGLFNTVIDWDLKLKMADGVRVTVKPGSNSTKFIGVDGKLELSRHSIRTFPENLRGDLPPNNLMKNTVRQVQDFADCIRSRNPTKSPIADSLRSDIVSHLCDIAIRTGERITWDPASHSLTEGDSAARSMINRPARTPWDIV